MADIAPRGCTDLWGASKEAALNARQLDHLPDGGVCLIKRLDLLNHKSVVAMSTDQGRYLSP